MKKEKSLFNSLLRACMMALFLLFAVAVNAQNVTVKGTVKDQFGEPVIGATVKVLGSTTGVITDFDGNYTISAPSNAKLEFSYIGTQTQVIPVAGKTSIDVTVKEAAMAIDEVVVTALGVKRQSRSLGYSTTKVDGEQFTMVRDPNIGNALSGKVAGVSVAGNATGSTGSSRVVIRGNASLTGNNMPLYVVDGVPFDNSNQGSAGTWGGADMGDGLKTRGSHHYIGLLTTKNKDLVDGQQRFTVMTLMALVLMVSNLQMLLMPRTGRLQAGALRWMVHRQPTSLVTTMLIATSTTGLTSIAQALQQIPLHQYQVVVKALPIVSAYLTIMRRAFCQTQAIVRLALT